MAAREATGANPLPTSLAGALGGLPGTSARGAGTKDVIETARRAGVEDAARPTTAGVIRTTIGKLQSARMGRE